MKKTLGMAAACGLFAAFATAAMSADRAIVVLDGSGSMWGQIDGRPKLAIARETLRSVLTTVPADTELGLMAYGHRQKGVCGDIELIVAPAAGTAAAVSDAADKMRFLGMTPLSEAVKQAAESLRYTEEKATVILITDGIETCNADPCALGTALEEAGVDFTAHVVGFGLSDDEGKKVACLAENTGGKYIQAGDADGLRDALTTVVAAAPEPAPRPAPEPAPPAKPEFNFVPTVALAEGAPDLADDAGQYVDVFRANDDGSRGEELGRNYGNWKGDLDPGRYVVEIGLGEAKSEQIVEVKNGETAAPHFVLNAGTLTIKPHATPGGEIVDGAAVIIDFPGEGESIGYGQVTQVLPAGDQLVKVTIGQGEVTETVALAASETVEKDIVVGVGRAVLNAYYTPGMLAEDGLYVEVFKAAKKMDGSRVSVSYGYGAGTSYDLPPGDYVALARMDKAEAESPFSVKLGELTEVNVTLNAGVLAVSAPGADFIEVFGAARNIQGERKSFGYQYGDAQQFTLPAGDYVVRRRLPNNGGEAEAAATVKAGERAETTFP